MLEVVSISTALRDLSAKRDIHASPRVREFFPLDPTGDKMQPVPQGYRLNWECYEPLPAQGQLEVLSALLGLDLWMDGRMQLRVRDVQSRENLLSAEESEACQ